MLPILLRTPSRSWFGEAMSGGPRSATLVPICSVTNSARMLARSRSRRHERERTVPAVIAQGELLRDPAVVAAVAQLSVRQRAAVFLTYWEDLGTVEVARRMGVSEGAVKRHLARGRSVLREVLT